MNHDHLPQQDKPQITATFIAVNSIRIIQGNPNRISVILNGRTLNDATLNAPDPNKDTIIYYKLSNPLSHMMALLVEGNHYAITKFCTESKNMVIEASFDNNNQQLTETVLSAI